jgi:hypothetical protein
MATTGLLIFYLQQKNGWRPKTPSLFYNKQRKL